MWSASSASAAGHSRDPLESSAPKGRVQGGDDGGRAGPPHSGPGHQPRRRCFATETEAATTPALNVTSAGDASGQSGAWPPSRIAAAHPHESMSSLDPLVASIDERL